MVEQRKPIVTELALADSLDQLVNLIEELRVDVDLRVEITTDDTQLLKLSLPGTPDVGFPLQRESATFPARWLTGALLDRLTHHVHILEMNGDSYRLKGSLQSAPPH